MTPVIDKQWSVMILRDVTFCSIWVATLQIELNGDLIFNFIIKASFLASSAHTVWFYLFEFSYIYLRTFQELHLGTFLEFILSNSFLRRFRWIRPLDGSLPFSDTSHLFHVKSVFVRDREKQWMTYSFSLQR